MKGNKKIMASLLLPFLLVSIRAFCQENIEPAFKKQIVGDLVYVAKPYTGSLVSYYENGQIKVKESYLEGVKRGKSEYYEDGKIMNEEAYDQTKEGVGDKVSEIFVAADEKREVENEYREHRSYYKNSQLKEKTIYRNGRMDGYHMEYYEDGQLKEKATYKLGIPEGEYLAYYANSQLRLKRNYVQGELHGSYVWYYENGEVKEKTEYKMGKAHGESILYYKNTQIEKIENYRDGELLNETVYYSDGKLMFQEDYTRSQDENDNQDSREVVMAGE